MDEDKTQSPIAEDADMEKVFKFIGGRAALPDNTRERWEEIFKSELDKVVSRRRRRRLALSASFAGLALLALIYGLITPEVTAPPVAARLTSSVGQVVKEGSPVAAGTAVIDIRTSESLGTGAGSYARLDYRHADVRLDENTDVQLLSDRIILLEGRLFLATSGTGESPIRVSAGTAVIGDIGTQFLVAFTDRALVTQVRDGAIVVTLPSGEYQVSADGAAGKLELSQGGEVNISQVERYGESWDWILHITPEFVVEGRTVSEFLQWFSSETGKKLAYADQQAEWVAQTTILHGELGAITPLQGVDAVLATTRLTARRSDPDQILIVLGDK